MSPKRAEIEILLNHPSGAVRAPVMGWQLGPLAITPALDRGNSVEGAPVFHRRQWNATHVATGMTAGLPPGGDRSKAAALAWARALLAAAPEGFWEAFQAPPGYDECGPPDLGQETARTLREIARRACEAYDLAGGQ